MLPARLLCTLLLVGSGPSSDKTPDFDRTIAPLLTEHCLECHRGSRPRGGLDLSRRTTALLGGDGGPALVPGQPAKSLLLERIDADEMPPRHPLSPAQKKLVRDWIRAGAPWSKEPLDPLRFTTGKRAGYDWWSLRPVQRPPVQTGKPSTNPVDIFIAAELQAAGLSPSPPADRRTLIRRLSFDLVGLPPTWEETQAFLQDRRPDAYERLVDRLLASPHYGERWARHWLDIVRYGESSGFERNDPRVNAWHYRDWVVRALNADMPFDEFCRLQIAGDVLRPDDPDAAVATGYLVAGIHNTVVPMNAVARETAFQDELEDLVGNVGQTFLGLTTNCARCHDHKFDPITLTDYYRLASALSGIRHGEREVRPTFQGKELPILLTERQRLEKSLAAMEAPIRQAVLRERKQGKKPVHPGPRPIAAWDFRTSEKDSIGSLEVHLLGGARRTPRGLVFDGKKAYARTPPLQRNLQGKTLEAWVQLDNLQQRGGGVMTVQTPGGAVFDAIVYGEKDPGQWLAGSDFFRRTDSFQGSAEKEAASRPIHLAIVHEPDGTIRAYREGRPYGRPYRKQGPAAFTPGKTVVAFGIRHEPPGGNRMLAGIVVRARLYDRALSAEDIARTSERDDYVPLEELLTRMSPTGRQRHETLQGNLTRINARIAHLEARRRPFKVYAALSKQPPPTRVLQRGQVAEPGEVVAPGGIPALAGTPFDFGLPPDAPEGLRRKKLAEWITHPVNPLFPRVLVNRLWHHHFGRGLVETPSDFGFNGGRPSHPKLLDWLAAEFASGGYRLKPLHRLLVLSHTYRQASLPRPEAWKKDADERLVWRKRPARMEGEVLRDTMLSVAGLLVPEVGGKGFSDYRQTAGAGTTYYEPFDPQGPEFHRRSLYRFVPRGANPGLLEAFDCPDPAAAAPRRNATTTPLQALALWNGAFALRMAQALADRVDRATGEKNSSIQATHVFRLTLQRDPTDDERRRAADLIDRHGLRALCRALLNCNEFLTVP